MTASDGPAPVLLERDGEVAVITLNRPEKRNAMNVAAQDALLRALEDCRGSAKAIVLTGAGTAFCSGIDLKEAAVDPADSASPRRAKWRRVQETIKDHPSIVIAAVNGFALGGGVSLINSADLAIAAEDAVIGMPEIGFGIYPGVAGPSTQLRLNQKRAAWMVLTAEHIDGRTAAEWGLVNRAVPLEDLAVVVRELANDVARFDAIALEYSKKALWHVPARVAEWSDALEYGEEVGAEIRTRSNAAKVGLTAFESGARNPGQGAGA